jgi:hypothetical protein
MPGWRKKAVEFVFPSVLNGEAHGDKPAQTTFRVDRHVVNLQPS